MKMLHSYNNLKGRKGGIFPNSVKDSPLWEAGSRSAVQLIPQTACNPHSRYDTYSNPQSRYDTYSNPHSRYDTYRNPHSRYDTYSNPYSRYDTYSNPQVVTTPTAIRTVVTTPTAIRKSLRHLQQSHCHLDRRCCIQYISTLLISSDKACQVVLPV
jgi:hypothetical protein